MKQFDVTGMSCAACSARVEKAVNSVEGVTQCSVNLLTNSMNVEGGNVLDIIAAVENAGYGAKEKGSKGPEKSETNSENKELSKLKTRLFSSVGFLAVLMYISMGHVMWGFPLPEALSSNPLAIALSEMLLSVAVMVINQKFFINGFKGLLKRAPNMDTLVAMGSSAAFVWSSILVFQMTEKASDFHALHELLHGLWYEAAAMILTLITVGKMLESRAKGKTTDAIKGLMKLKAKTAVIIKDGKEVEVEIEKVRVGDIFVVRPGQSVAVDGVIVEGSCSVDESSLTGESIPVDKKEGDEVFAATINKTGFIKCKAERVGENTTLSQIIKMVSDAAATKAPIAKVADKVSGIFVPAVICIAIVTVALWLFSDKGFAFALARGISVLVISCPCALGLATPVAIMVGSGVGAKNGILFKNAVSIEQTGKTQIVVLDKTGTVTKGQSDVTDIIPEKEVSEEELLFLAYTLENKSEHPLSKAVKKRAEEVSIKCGEVESFRVLSGSGLEAQHKNELLFAGNLKFMEERISLSQETKETVSALSGQGKTPLLFAWGKKFLGIIAVADVIREESKEAIEQMRKMGLRVVMLTGDNANTAKAIAASAGIDEVISDVLPDGKEKVIAELKKQGKVLMVGDGINDAPALTAADMGVAVGAGTDIAIDAADVILMKSRLTDVPAAIRLSKATLKNIHENLFWAFIYNTLGIPLAAGAFISLFGWELNPMFGAAAMSLSSFCVVSNALRLNLFDVHKIRHYKIKQSEKENVTMKKTMKIEGMMCPHCSGRVKKVLEELSAVVSAEVSHESGTAVVTLSENVSEEALKAAVEAQGYAVTGIE